MADTHQVKFVSDGNVSYEAAHSLALELIQLDINHYDFYIPRYNTKMIVFKYNSSDNKNKLLNYHDLSLPKWLILLSVMFANIFKKFLCPFVSTLNATAS